MSSEEAFNRAMTEASLMTDSLFTRVFKNPEDYYEEGQIICNNYYSYVISDIKIQQNNTIQQSKSEYDSLCKKIEELRKVVNAYKKAQNDTSSNLPIAKYDSSFAIILDDIMELIETNEAIIKKLNEISIQ